MTQTTHSGVPDSMNIHDHVAELERDPEWGDELQHARAGFAQLERIRVLSQRGLAKTAETSKSQLASLEQESGSADLRRLRDAARALSARIDELIGVLKANAS